MSEEERLALYTRLVLAANARFNLTGAKSESEFAPHIADSLTVLPYIQGPYIDIGSGAGLPGIPVALASGVDTTLLEATAKKAKFLTETIEALGLKARVIAARAEDAGRDPEWREHFQSATIRAVASASAALELAAPFLAVGGLAILQRAAAEPGESEALSVVARELGCAVESEVRLEGEKRLLLVRKTGATPERFPRRPGIAQSRPRG
ncbi:MAG TPA: 16S rRNA (guanine(527)-N(7))-methyltransferase RsmG [Candidatus Rubrimentiphilum sp.]|nr:16S rRNA (guanine(527)-N(7))-methyltransferase RsmG [Candidatus Rubrimentiphilum sp.]